MPAHSITAHTFVSSPCIIFKRLLSPPLYYFFFFKDTPTPEFSPLPLPAPLPICPVRTLVHAACRLAHGMGCPGAFGPVGEPAECRGVRHVRARLEVTAVLVGDAQRAGDQLDRQERNGVVEGLVVVTCVALDRVRERVHS